MPAVANGQMYMRFTLLRRNRDSKRKEGLLLAAHELRDNADLTVAEHRELRELLAWFNVNLNHPACLKEPGNHRALSWFKPQAKKPLGHMWRLVEILRRHDVETEVHKTRDPGIVLYEDGWQVVAKPKKGARVSW